MDMKLEPYAIFNDAFGTQPTAGHYTTFWPFPRLPAELRTQIWTECIPARRFIRVLLDNDRVEVFPELYTTKNELGNVISGWPYRVRAAGSKEWSPDTLARVNREASNVFRRICRICANPYPVHSPTYLDRNPRPIKADLTQVAVSTDPRRNVFLWNRFKANFGVGRQIDVRYILTAMPSTQSAILGHAGFVEVLQRDDEIWADWTAKLGQQVWGERMDQEEYEAQRISLPQAARFWSFPQEAFGDVPDIDEIDFMGTAAWEPKMVKDLSGFHPGIGVFNLP
ncbi:uncharacterized protein BCR38DRAFT_519772 [Pseudomassariella vexata]|uniref:2EXR domain-containing protein n=1 Tax=Pseudomassariella vexata TaxID=1141098 RepID=A0A1Y2EIG6_9PEZI|nr:uncharacterized protein BCR38DRAFT_519772 [Pseudomassariella vexata]ORY71353.1 hypothetical protein BCR38DRAFT_519772 [Pseudomassariella vexata]